MGEALAGWPGNAVLHARSRSPPSRTGVHAGASTRIPLAAKSVVRSLELGKAVERVRLATGSLSSTCRDGRLRPSRKAKPSALLQGVAGRSRTSRRSGANVIALQLAVQGGATDAQHASG